MNAGGFAVVDLCGFRRLLQGQLEDALGHSKTGVLAQIKEKTRDNTLDLLSARKETSFAARERETELKNSLLATQQQFVSDWAARKAAMEAEKLSGVFGGLKKTAPAAEAKQPEGPAQLPRHWREAIDGATGATYYWNVQSGEATWTRPVLTPLPEGWFEAQDTRRKSYYYHKASGKVAAAAITLSSLFPPCP